MARDSRYDILFEPVRIGPVTAPNRFYQVPHCNGMGRHYPASMIEMRRQKAEGGWGVVCTEQVDIHPTSDVSPAGEIRMWDDRDLPVLARTAEAIHEHGALAGIELTHNGTFVSNLYSREVPLGPVSGFGLESHPVQARAMDGEDIKAFRRWHREAALRAKRAGFRSHLRLRRPQRDTSGPVPLARLQPAQRRIRWQHREPGASPRGDPGRYQGGCR